MEMNIAEFYDKVSTDAALQQAIIGQSNGDIEAMVQNAVTLGASMGYVFTAEEARQYGATLDELPEELLDVISAGAPTSCATENGALNV